AESVDDWKKRFEVVNVKHGEVITSAGQRALPFEDEEGLRLILLNNDGEEIPEEWQAWNDSIVPSEHRILGMGPIEVTVKNLNKLEQTLTEIFGYVVKGRTEEEVIFQSIDGQTFGE